MPTPQEILEDLKQIRYPGYTRDIVSFGIVRDIEIASAGISVTLAPGGASEEVIAQIRKLVAERVIAFAGVPNVDIAMVQEAQPARPRERGPEPTIPGVRHVIAVASGKGGVGKSTVAVNFALALKAEGYRVGLLDADVYGPSVPLMLGLTDRPETRDDDRIVPPEILGIKAISMGMFVAAGMPIIWRGPMLTKLLTQFLREVEWGDLDYLVIDLPPGTGDAHLTIVQQVRLSGGVIVTTPQDVALLDVQRGIKMFNQVNAPILGLVENMSYHLCSCCGERAEIFGHGGGKRMAGELGIPFLGEIPLVKAIREGSDSGHPVVAAAPDSLHARAFRDVARRVAEDVDKTAGFGLPVVH